MYLLFIFSFLCLPMFKIDNYRVVKGFSHFGFLSCSSYIVTFPPLNIYFFHFLFLKHRHPFYIFYSSMIKIIKWKSFFNDLGFLSLFILSYVISFFLFYPRIFDRDLFLSLFILSYFFFYLTHITN